MSYPKISLVTPSFNQEEFIENTIRSVVLQDYPNLEYVVIDGGSADNSIDIIKKYEDKIAYWVSEPDDGHGAGLNKGFERTSGEIMGWINSDDLLTPWSLRTVAEIFTKFPHVNWIQGTNSWWNRRGQMVKTSQNPKNIYDYLTGNYGWIQQESVFWRRSIWEEAGASLSKDYKFMVDGDLWARFFLIAELYTVECVLGGYRSYGDNRASGSYTLCVREMQEAISQMRLDCDPGIKADAKKLKILLDVSESDIFRKTIGVTNVQKIFGKTIGKRLFQVARYKAITWDTAKGDWVETNLPFRC